MSYSDAFVSAPNAYASTFAGYVFNEVYNGSNGQVGMIPAPGLIPIRVDQLNAAASDAAARTASIACASSNPAYRCTEHDDCPSPCAVCAKGADGASGHCVHQGSLKAKKALKLDKKQKHKK